MVIRPDYPRSTLSRSSFLPLDGEWDFLSKWQNGIHYPSESKILVPFSPETKESGIHQVEESKFFTYGKKFPYQKKKGKRLLLHFEGVDYLASLYINGQFVSSHIGAYERFTSDITNFVKDGENEIILSVYDDDTRLQVRGKQRWENHVFGCFYLPTSGIFKSVWMEEVSPFSISSLSIRTRKEKADIAVELLKKPIKNGELDITLTDRDGNVVCRKKITIDSKKLTFSFKPSLTHPWSVEDPYLYDLQLSVLKDGEVVDTINSYVGFRTLEKRKDHIYFNGKDLFLKMVLDQGYYQDSGLTAKSFEEMEKDVKLIKEMGFNGVRVHQKIEDERFYTLLDQYGLLCFLEMPSMYTYSKDSEAPFQRQWKNILKEHDHHPSIIAYVPFNETWGLNDEEFIHRKDIQAFVNSVVRETKKFDSTRFTISNDGWEHTKSDLLTLHIYEQDSEKFKENFSFEQAITASPLCSRHPYVPGYSYQGEPILFTEFGGASFKKDLEKDAWGYGSAVEDEKGFLERLKSLVDMLSSLSYCRGYCYTQFSDVEQEVNGLVKPDRSLKAPVEQIRKIIENGGK